MHGNIHRRNNIMHQTDMMLLIVALSTEATLSNVAANLCHYCKGA